MISLGCGIITRNKDAEILDRALASLKGVDKIYITVADATEPDDAIKAIAEKYLADLSYFHWDNRFDSDTFDMDFAAARNFNMARCKEDWYTWLDSDDEVEGMEKAKGYLEQLHEEFKYGICTYNYSFFPSGKVDTKHPKERFFRMDAGFRWKGALHENCLVEYETKGVMFDDILWNHRSDDKRSTESCLRNIKVVEREIRQQNNNDGKVDPRTVFNLGMALSSYAQKTDAQEDWARVVRAFYRYIEMAGWDQHAFMAWRFAGSAHMKLSRPDLALKDYFEALQLQPSYRDVYASIGSAYLALSDNDKAKSWLKLALVAGEENKYAHDDSTSLIMPLLSLSEIYATEGKLEDSFRFLTFAKKIVGNDSEAVNMMLNEVVKMRSFIKKAKKIREKLEKLPVEEQKTAFDKLPQDIKSAPDLVAFRRSKAWKTTTNGHELVIYTGKGWEQWNPDSVKTGIGGSEEAVIYLSQSLRDLGWDVTVYGNIGTAAKDYDGVMYRPFWEWSPEEPTDVFIGWRYPFIFDTKINAKKRYLWLHDTNPEASITPKILATIDKIFVLSEYHRSLYPNLPDDKFMLSANGILPEQFQVIEKKPQTAMYVSAPNRGLLPLLQMWPKIKERLPEATLYWAYGWETFDIMMKSNPSAKMYKDECVKLLEQPGVVELGRIGHEELAKRMCEAKAWLYPTEFTEIYCISAIKAQAAGMTPVTTNVAALDETVQYGFKMDVKDLYTNPEAQQQFIDNAVKALTENYDKQEDMVKWAKENWTWDKVARQWDEEFKK